MSKWDDDDMSVDPYDEDDGSYVYESDDSDGGMEYDEMKVAAKPSDTYTVYNLEEIGKRQRQVAEALADVLALSPEEAGIILRHYKWNPEAVKARWFDGGEEQIREQVGVSEGSEEPMTPADSMSEAFCDTCMSDVPVGDLKALSCGHTYCDSCWREYLADAVEEGLSCVFTRCMGDCNEAVPDAWFQSLLPKALAEKHRRFLLFSFVEHNQLVRWCSRPGCQHAVEYPPGGMRDIECRCGNVFCFACGAEPHRPASCENVHKWMEKCSAESENVTWIIANTKKCPKCRKPIEKNQGCNHMTCRKTAQGCGHEFCWLCLGPWKDHGNATGGYYKCNKYEAAKAKGLKSEEETSAAKAKSELDYYIHHFDRYMNHDRARKVAIKQLPDIQVQQETLQSVCGYALSDVTFMREAAEQVIKCRQVLKWTYVFGFYLKNETEKHLFEHLQEQLEKNTENLHGLVEEPLDVYLDKTRKPDVPFFDHRSNVTNFTAITKKFLNGLLVGVEGGLTESGRAEVAM